MRRRTARCATVAPRSTRARVLPGLVVAVLCSSLVVACGSHERAAPPATSGPAGAFVDARGTSFTVNGAPFRFVGFNLYNAAAAGQGFYSCTGPEGRYSVAQLDAAMAYMHDVAGATVLRFWAYQTFTRAGTDWSGVDAVIRAARANGMRVLPVLEDGPGYCTTGPSGTAKYAYEGDTWFESGYTRPYGSAAIAYPEYVARVVAHYRDDPTILGWEMFNEATTSARVGGGQSAVVPFARTIGALIHSIDPHHLVTVGTESDGWPGASGSDFASVYGLQGINFAVAHDYQSPGQHGDYDPEPMNGLTAAGKLPSPSTPGCQGIEGPPLACSVAEAARLDKPMVIDEVAVGARSDDRGQLQARAALFDRKFAAGFDNGVSGELVWDFNRIDVTTSGNFDVEQYDHDPLVATMARWAARIAT